MENQMKAGGLFENENGFIILSSKQRNLEGKDGKSIGSKAVFMYRGKQGDVILDTSDNHWFFSIYYDKGRYTRSVKNDVEVEESSLFTRLHDEDFVRDAGKAFGVPICTEDDLEERWEKENPKPEEYNKAPMNVTLSFTRSFSSLKRGLYSASKLSPYSEGLISFLNPTSANSIYDMANALVAHLSRPDNHYLPTLELTPDYLRVTTAYRHESLKFEERSNSDRVLRTWTVVVDKYGSMYQRAAKKHGWNAVEKK